MKEELVYVLPRYLNALVSHLLSGVEAQLGRASLAEEQAEALGLSQESQKWHEISLPQLGIHDLKQSLSDIIHRVSLSDVVYAMSTEEQLLSVFLIHSLHKSLIGFTGSLEQLQQSPEVAALAALLLDVVQCAGQVDSEQSLSQNIVLPMIISAMSSMIYENGLIFLQHPLIMEALEALEGEDDGSSGFSQKSYLVAALHRSSFHARSKQFQQNGTLCVMKIMEDNEDSPVDEVAAFGKYYSEIISAVCSSKHFQKVTEKGKRIVGMNRRALSYKVRKLIGDSRDGYKRHTHGGMEVEVRDDVELVCMDSDTDNSIHDVFVPFDKKEESTMRDDPVKEYVNKRNLVTQELSNKMPGKSAHYMDIPLSQSSQEQRVPLECEGRPTPSSPRRLAIQTKFCEEVDSNDPVESASDKDQGSDFSSSEESLPCDSTDYKQCTLPPPTPTPLTLWCWKRRVKPLSLANMQHFISKVSQHVLEERDTECHETICHAVVSIFDPESAVTLICALKKRSMRVFGCCDKQGNTPLHNAVMAGNLVVVENLIDINPATVYISNNDGATPIDSAMHLNNHQIVECLIHHVVTSDPHTCSTNTLQLLQSYLLKAMKIGYTEYLRILLKLHSQHTLTIDFECTDSDQHTAWFHLQQKAPHVQEAAINALNSSSLGRTLLRTFVTKQVKVTDTSQSTVSLRTYTQDLTEESLPDGKLISKSVKPKSMSLADPVISRPCSNTPTPSLSRTSSMEDIAGTLAAAQNACSIVAKEKPTSLPQKPNETQEKNSLSQLNNSGSLSPTPGSPTSWLTQLLEVPTISLNFPLEELVSEEDEQKNRHVFIPPACDPMSCIPAETPTNSSLDNQTEFSTPNANSLTQNLSHTEEAHSSKQLTSTECSSAAAETKLTSLGSDVDKPGSVEVDKPGSVEEDKPGSVEEDKPGSVEEDKPGSDVDKPGSVEGDKPGSDEEDKPGSDKEEDGKVGYLHKKSLHNSTPQAGDTNTLDSSLTRLTPRGDSDTILQAKEQIETDDILKAEDKTHLVIVEGAPGICKSTIAFEQVRQFLTWPTSESQKNFSPGNSSDSTTEPNASCKHHMMQLPPDPNCGKESTLELFEWLDSVMEENTSTNSNLPNVSSNCISNDHNSLNLLPTPPDLAVVQDIPSQSSKEHSSEESDESNDTNKFKSLHFRSQFQYTDSVSSSPGDSTPEKTHSISKTRIEQRKEAAERNQKYRPSTSESDFNTGETKCTRRMRPKVLRDSESSDNSTAPNESSSSALACVTDTEDETSSLLSSDSESSDNSTAPNESSSSALACVTDTEDETSSLLSSDSESSDNSTAPNESSSSALACVTDTEDETSSLLSSDSESSDNSTAPNESSSSALACVTDTEDETSSLLSSDSEPSELDTTTKLHAQSPQLTTGRKAGPTEFNSECEEDEHQSTDSYDEENIGTKFYERDQLLGGHFSAEVVQKKSIVIRHHKCTEMTHASYQCVQLSLNIAHSDTFLDVLMLHLSLYFPTYSCSSFHDTKVINVFDMSFFMLAIQQSFTGSVSQDKKQCNKSQPKSFNKKEFKEWLLIVVHNAGYCMLRHIVHSRWHVVFGFSQFSGKRLTKSQKQRVKIILEVAQSKQFAIPECIKENLRVLRDVMYPPDDKRTGSDPSDIDRGKKPKPLKKDKPKKNGKESEVSQTFAPYHGGDCDYLTGTTTATTTTPDENTTVKCLDTHTVPENYLREHKDRIRTSAELLHAQDYPRIFPIAYEGKPPHTLPPELRIPYIFITGLAYYKLSSHKKSVQYFQQCLQLAEECGRDGDMTICCIYIGDIEFAQRKYNEAAERYQKALHYYSRDSVAKYFRMILPTQSALWSKCGSAFKNASKMADSISAYEEAIEQASSKKDKLAAHTSLGNLYQGIGENGRAVKEYEDAIQLAAELDDKISLGWNHGNLGNALLGLYQRDKALHHLFKALDMAVEHETTPQAIGRAYNNLGTAYQAINDYSEAEKHYDLALAQAIYGNDIPGQARVYGNIGNLQMLKKEFDRAVPHYTEVMRLSQDKSTVTTAHHNRGCAYYDWAEKKKMALHERTSPKSSIRFKVSLHGPQFEHCEDVYMPMMIPSSIQKYYLQGTKDLEYVMKHHEESFHGIKGSSQGLSLSVSLFETNSRTFHRMQDCLIHLKKSEDEPSRFEDALLVAEQSRARTLGELLLKRRGPQLKHQLMSPPSLAQLKSIVARQSCPVVYLSYTGERLLGWVLVPTTAGECSLNMFEVPLSDSEFDGKSFDYHLRYSLNELLVEKRFEMYKPFEDEKEQTDPVKKLYNLVAKPLMTMLNTLMKGTRKEVQKIIIVPDSYTNLLPYACLLNEVDEKFWGDEYYFQIMPSLLTMGILDQLPTVSVTIPVEHQQMICVVGNPTIPPFKYNDDEWNLGKLPHATKEAEWVAHILKCKPILHEQATKDAVIMRAMNAKVIHLATHGSAVAGFLAFAGISASASQTVEAKKVLLYPEEVENLNITPALVVLSSCDSGRGVFKADGIQGMARAFILAGAQAVLTTLWRVPDESACIFMQFFYQYLVDGVRGTEALHKAMLSVRCFSKYSQYIHWSGYQLTGRDFQFTINQSSSAAEVTARLGNDSIFPQLDILKKLEGALLNNPRLPTDVQVLFLLYNNVNFFVLTGMWLPFPIRFCMALLE